VTVGPWLGPFGLFVVDEATAKLLPAEYLIPCVDTDDLDYSNLRTLLSMLNIAKFMMCECLLS
jgi:hypothetical protein